jgi:hypothetical protein
MHLAFRSTTTAPCRPATRRGLPALGLALLLGACSTPEIGFMEQLWSPFGGSRNAVATDSLTVQRVRGANPEVAPLLPEAGNVWPEPEAPRPTLLSGPEEAFRDIPDYQPQLIQGAPPAASPVPTPIERRGIPRSPSLSPGAPPPAARSPVSPPFAAPTPPPFPSEGQVTLDPSGRPAIGTGQAGRVRGFTQPGVGGGAVIRDGNVETWIGPDGQARSRVVTP